MNASGLFGYGNSGFNITLDDTAGGNIHFYQASAYTLNGTGQLLGTWQPDGRAVDPLAAGSAFGGTPTGTLGQFSGSNPNGRWTLYTADLSSGGQSTLLLWELAITTVATPEPLPQAMFSMGLTAFTALLKFKRPNGWP